MSLKGATQNLNDTNSTRISNYDLRTGLILIENYRLDSMRFQRNLTVLRERITARDGIILQLNKRIATYEALRDNYEKIIKGNEAQLKLSSDLTNVLSKQIKKERTKTVIVGIAGLIATGLTLYLTTK